MKVKNDFCSKLFPGSILTMAAGLLLTFGLILVGSVVCQQTEVEAKAKTKVITVKKIDQKTAKKVHQQLLKGKAFTIRFKGGEKSFYKKFQKLTKKVAKQTDVGFDVFPICMESSRYFGTSPAPGTIGHNPKQSGGYTTFKVTKSDCAEYKYGIKFAVREYKDFKTDVDKALKESEYLYNALSAGTVEPYARYKTKEALMSDTGKTITNLKVLSRYLTKTKFRNLSGAMKARMVLPIGEGAMSYEDKGHIYTFKSLYKNSAYGKCTYFAQADCKISAVFNIGDFDFLGGLVDGKSHAIMRVKVKTLGGKNRYIMLSNGEVVDYNDYIGFKISDTNVDYRRSYKKRRTIKKINPSKQLRWIDLIDEESTAVEIATDEILLAYKFTLDRSEW